MTSLKKILLFILIPISSNLSAQTLDSLLTNYQVKGNLELLGAAVTLEKRIAEKFTVYLEGGLKSDFGLNYSRYKASESIKMVGFIGGSELRYYYNLNRRMAKGKSIENNSGNFWSLGANYSFKPFLAPSEIARHGVTTISPSWGIQRVVGNKFCLETALGLSINYFEVDKKWFAGPGLGFKFGYVLR
jgi:hypothetical protein